jgi:hypothetical protein
MHALFASARAFSEVDKAKDFHFANHSVSIEDGSAVSKPCCPNKHPSGTKNGFTLYRWHTAL